VPSLLLEPLHEIDPSFLRSLLGLIKNGIERIVWTVFKKNKKRAQEQRERSFQTN